MLADDIRAIVVPDPGPDLAAIRTAEKLKTAIQMLAEEAIDYEEALERAKNRQVAREKREVEEAERKRTAKEEKKLKLMQDALEAERDRLGFLAEARDLGVTLDNPIPPPARKAKNV